MQNTALARIKFHLEKINERLQSVMDPISGQRVNKDFLLKLLNNRPDLRQRFNEKGTIH